MLVVMTVHTEVLPVAAVGRIVMVITVAMVNGEELEIVLLKLPAALGADPAMQFQGTLPVVFMACLRYPHQAHYLVQLNLRFLRHLSRSQIFGHGASLVSVGFILPNPVYCNGKTTVPFPERTKSDKPEPNYFLPDLLKRPHLRIPGGIQSRLSTKMSTAVAGLAALI
jgi:hypothetical protein